MNKKLILLGSIIFFLISISLVFAGRNWLIFDVETAGTDNCSASGGSLVDGPKAWDESWTTFQDCVQPTKNSYAVWSNVTITVRSWLGGPTRGLGNPEDIRSYISFKTDIDGATGCTTYFQCYNKTTKLWYTIGSFAGTAETTTNLDTNVNKYCCNPSDAKTAQFQMRTIFKCSDLDGGEALYFEDKVVAQNYNSCVHDLDEDWRIVGDVCTIESNVAEKIDGNIFIKSWDDFEDTDYNTGLIIKGNLTLTSGKNLFMGYYSAYSPTWLYIHGGGSFGG